MLGVLLDERGQSEAAVEHYRRALAADPDQAGTHFYLGNVLMRAGRYGAAARHYGRSVVLEPKNYPARLLEAMAMWQADAPDVEVRERLDAAVMSNPEQDVFPKALARLLATSSDPAVLDGQRALDLALGLFNQFNSLENAETLAMGYAAVGRFDDAATLQRDAINATTAAGQFMLLPWLEENLAYYEMGKQAPEPWAGYEPLLQPPPVNAIGPFRDYPTLHAY
jgi:tetratricopeptide (TPR) repeat protein